MGIVRYIKKDLHTSLRLKGANNLNICPRVKVIDMYNI